MVRIDSSYQNYKNKAYSDQLEISSSNIQSNTCYKCILVDMTDPENTCRRHAITLSGSCTLQSLVKEASSQYSYEPDSFNLMWKNNNQLSNISEIQSTLLADLGLSCTSKNIFEIHEKEGPPKRLKTDDFVFPSPNSQTNIFDDDLKESHSPSRRNACSNTSYGPVNSSLPSFSLFEEDNNGYVGLINQAMTCYLNSLLQTLYMTPEFRNRIYRWNHSESSNEQEDLKKNIPYQLQRLFLNLQTSKKKSIQTHDLTTSFGWNSDDAFQQHDVQELYRVMFDALEKKMKKTKQENMINELYQGKIKDYVKCLECNTERAKVDVYLDIPLCIRPFGSDKTFESVEEALDAFIQPEILDESNKYYCEKCQQKCTAHKGLKFESFPYILSLQLKRFDFDYRTMSRFKIGSVVSFPEILNVKKYLPETTVEENCDYELFSIMIHSGSASGGHYYVFIKSFENNQWYNFNDEKVTKIDSNDIINTFGTTYSSYSSTTAYMLQYRQKNSKRNETFINVDQFEPHLRTILQKEIAEQLEADRLKEYMDNICKIRVIVPEGEISSDRVIDVHKDLTVCEATKLITKELDLEGYLDRTKKKLRILKFDCYNNMVEQSYKDENISVFEALGYSKNPFNVNWYVEFIDLDQQFIDYNPSDISVRIFELNIDALEAKELFTLRLNNEARVCELRNMVAQKIACEDKKVRMALEKMHSLCNYVNLEPYLSDCIQDTNFTRVNKVFVEYKDHLDAEQSFFDSKFYFCLDTLINLCSVSIFLPSDEQCDNYAKKSRRHTEFLKVKRSESLLNSDDTATVDSCDTLASEQTLSSIVVDNDQVASPNKYMEMYFKTDEEERKIEMETSMDEGIGGSNGSLSANLVSKVTSDMNWFDLKIQPKIEPSQCDDHDLDVHVDDNEINNIDDFSDDLDEKNSHVFDDVNMVGDIKNDDNDLNKKISDNEHLLDNIEIGCELESLPKYSELDLNTNSTSLIRNKRFIKSELNENKELGSKILEVKMDKRICLNELKNHINDYLKIGAENFRLFRICQDDSENEVINNENQFLYNGTNSKFLIKLGPALKYGEYLSSVFKLNRGTNKGSFTFVCDFVLYNGLSILHHKELLTDDLKDLCDIQVPIERIRLRRKNAKRPGNIFLNNEIVGSDVFINSNSDLCVEILEEAEQKVSKWQIVVYLRHWMPNVYELGDLEEMVLDDNSYNFLINQISIKSGIHKENIEVLKCLRDFPFKLPILDLHRNQSWKEDSYQWSERLEDGVCFYYRDKTLRLGELSSEKRMEIEKEDGLICRPAPTYSYSKKEIGIRIHVENS